MTNNRRGSEVDELTVIDKRIPIETEPKMEIQGDSPASMMIAALNKGVDLEKLEKFMDLQLKFEENEARKLFFEAVSAFKENPPEVLKDKENTQFKSRYTTLGNLLKTVNPALGKQGLSTSFDIDQSEKTITVSCILSHRQGHSEKVTMSAPPDTSGGNSKNPIQQIKSTITYLRSATFEAVTGLAATDATLDDDGNSSGIQYITENQAAEINKTILDKNIDDVKFLKFMKVDSVDKIIIKNFGSAINALKAAKGKPKTISCPEKDGKDITVKACEKCQSRAGCPSWG